MEIGKKKENKINGFSVQKKPIFPFYKLCAPVWLRLPVTQELTQSLKTLLVLHAKAFEVTEPSVMQVMLLKYIVLQ